MKAFRIITENGISCSEKCTAVRGVKLVALFGEMAKRLKNILITDNIHQAYKRQKLNRMKEVLQICSKTIIIK